MTRCGNFAGIVARKGRDDLLESLFHEAPTVLTKLPPDGARVAANQEAAREKLAQVGMAYLTELYSGTIDPNIGPLLTGRPWRDTLLRAFFQEPFYELP